MPASVRKRFAIFLVLGLSFQFQAQVLYSTRADYLKLKTERNNLLSFYTSRYPDTSVTELSNVFPRNFMGNIGLPSPRYILDYGSEDLGFRFFDSPTGNDRIKKEQVEYYRTQGPYAALSGIAGSKQLQAFKAFFTHTYKDKVNIALKFNRYSSMGFYKRQQSYANNFFLSSNYTTTNNRFGYYLYVLNNGNRNQENGGIKAGQLNDSTSQISKELLPVKFSAANRDNREIKLMINPWFRLNSRPDSVKGIDHYVQLKSSAAFSLYRYRDVGSKNDGFYNVFYLDTVSTNDSANVRMISNELNYSLISPGEKFKFSVGFKNEINKIWQKKDSLFFNNIISSGLVYRTTINSSDTTRKAEPNFGSALNAQYVVSGPNTGNYKIDDRTVYAFNQSKGNFLFLNLLYEKRSPDYIYNYWNSNHFQWFNNNYKPQEQFQANLGVSLHKKFTASLFYNTIYNNLYFDVVAMPRQYPATINYAGLRWEYKEVLLKHLGIVLSYTLQNTSNEAIMRLPKNSGTAKLFYTGNLFKNNLQLQLGSQVQLYQYFTPYAYMPATQVFHLQNNFKTETYPFVDVYLNARIRPVSFFLKLENALNRRLGNNYSMVPGYYQTDLAFRFGLTWVFFD